MRACVCVCVRAPVQWMCVAQCVGFQLGECFTQSAYLAKSISFLVCPFLRNAASLPSKPRPLVVRGVACRADGERGARMERGARGAGLGGSPGAPLGSDALQMRSHPLPPASSAG